MSRLKERLFRFMYGRYGSDNLSRFMLGVYVFVAVLGLFFSEPWICFLLWLVNAVLLVLMFFRMFSRNIYARQAENQKYLKAKRKVSEFFNYISNKWKYRKTHVYKKCPSCKCRLRLPKKKGSHTVKCPKCSNSFSVKI